MLRNHIFTMRASLINSFTIPVKLNCGISDFLSVPYTIGIKKLFASKLFLVVMYFWLSEPRKTKFQ